MAEGCFDVQKKKKNKLGEISMLFRHIIIRYRYTGPELGSQRAIQEF